MACEDIKEKIEDLKEDKRNLKQSMDTLTGRSLLAAEKELAQLEAQIAIEEINLQDCRDIEKQKKNPTPRPFVGRVDRIWCLEAKSETGKDEPYLIIASIDMLAGLSVGPLPIGTKPSVHCVKVGPWSDVEAGTTHYAAGTTHHSDALPKGKSPAFWDLDGRARIVNSPHDVVFLVSLVENDGSSPDAIRGAVQTALNASVLENLNRSYNSFASTLTSSMAGAIDTAALPGLAHLNADDRIGNVKQLHLTADDIDRINATGKLNKSLTFKRVNNSGKVKDEYTVYFKFEA